MVTRYDLPDRDPAVTRWQRFASAALLPASVSSLVAILFLRLYAVGQFPAVRTGWDDGYYRAVAVATAGGESGSAAAARLVLPHGGLFVGGRLDGYTSWLAAALKVRHFLGLGNAELAFQYANALMLLGATAVVLLFAYWSLGDWALAASTAFFYAAAPVVFGTSRWVHTENLVLLTGVAVSALAAWMLDRRDPILPRRRRWRGVAVAAAAWAMGLCSTTREYAAPSFVVLNLCVALGLGLQRRWRDAGIVAVVTGAFVVPWVPALVSGLKVTLAKGGQSDYFHPMTEWIPHVSFFTVGPVLLVVLLALGSLVVIQRSRRLLRGLADVTVTRLKLVRDELQGVQLLVWGHLFLLLTYAAGILLSRNRVTRPAIMLMLAGLGLVLVGIRSLPTLRAWLRRTPARLGALALVLVSWSVLAYQLLYAFDGGKTYAHASFRLEYFNYPLRLRPLKDAADTYTCRDVCPYDGS